jgi:hypothetical protein
MHQLERTAGQQETPLVECKFRISLNSPTSPLTSVLARTEALANQYAGVGLTNAQKQLKRKMWLGTRAELRPPVAPLTLLACVNRDDMNSSFNPNAPDDEAGCCPAVVLHG